MAVTKAYFSPILVLHGYTWLTKADSKFKPENPLYHTEAIAKTRQGAQALKERIDAATDAAFEDYLQQKVPKAEQRKWVKIYPYEEVCDSEGNPTGVIKFSFKQNSKIPLKDGGVKEIEIAFYDQDDVLIDGEALEELVKSGVYAGSEVRIRYSMRPIVVQGQKQCGVRLDFGAVQIIKKSDGRGASGGFGRAEGGDDTEGGAESGDEGEAY